MTLSKARLPTTGSLVVLLGMAGCAAIDDEYEDGEAAELDQFDQAWADELGDEFDGPVLIDPDSPESQIATIAAWRGEWFPMSGAYPNAIGYGWGAWDDAFRQMNWTGGGQIPIVVPRDGWYRTRVRVAGSTCDGYPQIDVCIYARCDTFSIGPGWSHQVGTWNWLRGGYGGTISVYFKNDYARSGCDRNIWLDHAWIEVY